MKPNLPRSAYLSISENRLKPCKRNPVFGLAPWFLLVDQSSPNDNPDPVANRLTWVGDVL